MVKVPTRIGGPVAADALLLWSVLFLPSTAMTALAASSMLLGLSVACLLIVCVHAMSYPLDLVTVRWRWSWFAALAAVFAVVLLHALLADILRAEVEWLRLLGGLLVGALVLFAGYTMRKRLQRHSPQQLHQLLMATAWMLTLLGYASLAGVPALPGSWHPLAVLVFPEPSFFALTYLPFAMYAVISSSGKNRWLFAVLALVLALGIKSTTLLAGLAIGVLPLLPLHVSFALMGLAAAGVLALRVNTMFLVERVVLSRDTENLSQLVLLQGWERAYLSIIETRGLGLGFQQFGISGPMGEFQQIIYAQTGQFFNLTDGGTTAAKLVGEFGWLAVVLLLTYLFACGQAILGVRRRVSGKRVEPMYLFFLICLICYGIELFIRGVGYFSAGLFLLSMWMSTWDSVRMGLPKREPRSDNPSLLTA